MNRRNASVAANPVLIGAATLLVVIVAVFLAYNANNGLPFVPTYQLTVQLPDAANLVTGNEVRIGGDRVGIIDKIDPVAHEDGSVTAKLHVKLETNVKPLPVDSTFIVRPRSALGIKYIEVTLGDSARGFDEGATVPLANAKVKPVEIDEFFNMFDEPTRDANQANLREFGDALAGRGSDLNTAIVALDPLVENLIPVMRNLSDPRHRARPALQGARADARSRRARGGRSRPSLCVNLAITFRRSRRGRAAVPAGHDQRRPASARHGDPLVPDPAAAARQRRRLLPGAAAGCARRCATAAPDLAGRSTGGTDTVSRAPPFNRRLEHDAAALQAFAKDPRCRSASRGLPGRSRADADGAQPRAGAGQLQLPLALLLQRGDVAESDGDVDGTWVRISILAPPLGPNSEVGQSSAPANGGREPATTISTRIRTPWSQHLAKVEGLSGRERGVRRTPAGNRQRPVNAEEDEPGS